MNIFFLDTDINKSAEWACDQHVVKMLSEHAQILCTVAHGLGLDPELIPMKATHAKHPCTLWAASSYAHFLHLLMLNRSYYREYVKRFGNKPHQGFIKGELLYERLSSDIKHGFSYVFGQDLTIRNVPQVVGTPTVVTGTLEQAVSAYRALYRGPKRQMLRYRHGPAPYWLDQE
jgi:hypothetical protein